MENEKIQKLIAENEKLRLIVKDLERIIIDEGLTIWHTDLNNL